jgi:hypothetical protein
MEGCVSKLISTYGLFQWHQMLQLNCGPSAGEEILRLMNLMLGARIGNRNN